MVLGFFFPAVLLVLLLLLAALLCVIGVLDFGSVVGAAEDYAPSAACIPDLIFS